MRASDFEISNYSKLDKILSKLCDMVVRGQESDQDYGMVAAAVLDPDNQIVARLNRPGRDGKRIHAEHAAMLDYTDKYGPIPKGSIVITTLSPCNEAMDERDGPSCTELINNSTVKKVYCGYMDPTQDDDTRQFNLMETADRELRNKCKKFANTFLDKINESNVFTDARMNAIKAGRKVFKVHGKTYNVTGDISDELEAEIDENFADGKNPQDKGDAKRHGINTKASVSSLRKTAKQGGRKGQLAHWMANMKSGRQK
jgi:pyrimidine deaminase RibD-like protein